MSLYNRTYTTILPNICLKQSSISVSGHLHIEHGILDYARATSNKKDEFTTSTLTIRLFLVY